VTVFIVDDPKKRFSSISFSPPESNRVKRDLDLILDDDHKLTGTIVEEHQGQSAYSLRLQMHQATDEEKTDDLKERYSELFPQAETDSFEIQGLDNMEEAVTIRCSVKIDSAGQEMGDRFLLKPGDIFSHQEMPLQKDNRRHPFIFDYAREVMETLNVTIPEAWAVEAIPSGSEYTDRIGECRISFKDDEKKLSVERSFKLNKPKWNAINNLYINKFYQTRQSFNEETVVLKRQN